MQLMPATARGLKVDPNDPDQNIRGGIEYDRALWGMWAGGDQLMLTFASYNAGPGCIQKASALAGSRSWPAVAAKLPAVTGKHAEETVRYVARIKGIYGGK
jgi:soluble lytic murein transglycosylase-like protein